MRLLCYLGLHKWNVRELHALEPVIKESRYMRMAIIERCDCGASRIPPSGGDKLTMTGLCVSTKFLPKNAEEVPNESS